MAGWWSPIVAWVRQGFLASHDRECRPEDRTPANRAQKELENASTVTLLFADPRPPKPAAPTREKGVGHMVRRDHGIRVLGGVIQFKLHRQSASARVGSAVLLYKKPHPARRNVMLLVVALVLGLTANGQTPVADNKPPRDTPQALKAALEAEGFLVQKGKFKVVDLFGMYDAGLVPSCFGNNPAAPYLLPLVPLGPGQTPENLPIPNPITDYPLVSEDKGLYMEYFLRPDEAIVLVGKTPPEVKYFGLRSYLVRRYSPADNGYKYIFASLGDTANNFTTATVDSADPYQQPVMFISTADAGIDRRIRAAASAAGYAPGIINTDVMPAPMIKLGSTGTPDSFLMLQRAALFADPLAQQAYYANPGMTVFRITPKSATNLEPFAVPELRIKGTGHTNELDLLETEEELGRAILARYDYLSPRDLQTSVAFEAGYDAIQRNTNALGDNRDTIYLRSDNFFLRERPDDFVIVYGANHAATGKATYSNFGVYGRIALNGVGSVDNTVFPTAEEFLLGNPLARYFYVYKIARHCDSNESLPCLAIPTGPGAAGIPVTQPAFLAFRAYVEPSTKVGPAYEEVLYDRAIKFNPHQ